MSIRILHVIPGLSPLYGGPTAVVLEMCRQLNRRGVEAEIATTDAGVEGPMAIALEQPFQMEGVTVYGFRSPFLHRYGFSWRLAHWLHHHVKRYDLLHIHAFFSFVTVPCVRAAQRHRIPYLLRPSGELDPWCLGRGLFKKKLYLFLAGRSFLRHASALHVTCEDEKAAIERLGLTTPKAVIPLGVTLLPEGALPPRGSFRSKVPQLSKRKLIVFLSRLDPKKGLDKLLPALTQLARQRDDFLVVLAGSGEKRYEASLQREISSNGLSRKVFFTGFLQGRDKLELLRDADCFVLPSYSENFGVAVVEAMGMGVPVVISDRVGIHREVAQYQAGLVTPCDSGAVARALATLLDDHPLRQQMGENARRLVKERFTWDRATAGLIDLYQSVLSR